MLEEALTAQVLPIRIFDPKRYDFLVGMAEGVFQIVQSRNQPGRQRRRALAVSEIIAEGLIQRLPVNRPGEQDQFVTWIQQIGKGNFEQVVLNEVFLAFGQHGGH